MRGQERQLAYLLSGQSGLGVPRELDLFLKVKVIFLNEDTFICDIENIRTEIYTMTSSFIF